MLNQENNKNNLINKIAWHLIHLETYYGILFQEFTAHLSEAVPTAALRYDLKSKKYSFLFNPEFLNKLELSQQLGIFVHEIMHFVHQHTTRFLHVSQNATPQELKLMNIAMDMAINQFINKKEISLPEGCVKVDNFKSADGQAFPKLSTAEVYYNLLQQTTSGGYGGKQKQQSKPQKGKGQGETPGDGDPVPDGQGTNDKEVGKYVPMDEHEILNVSEEELQEMLKDQLGILKRSVEKASFSRTNVPGYIADKIRELENEINKFDYKAILRAAVRKTMTQNDRDRSWTRQSRRFGKYAPGTTVQKTPRLFTGVDTSGSISYTELSEFTAFILSLIKVGAGKCELGLWHTELYKTMPFNKHIEITTADVQSGGTCVQPTLEYINKKNPELAIILTDGYYEDCQTYAKTVKVPIIWVISKQGNVNHPCKDIGKTVKMV